MCSDKRVTTPRSTLSLVDERVISLCLGVVILALFTASGSELLYGVMKYRDESLTFTVCSIVKM